MGAYIKLKNKKIYKGERIADIFVKSSKKLNQLIVHINGIAAL